MKKIWQDAASVLTDSKFVEIIFFSFAIKLAKSHVQNLIVLYNI